MLHFAKGSGGASPINDDQGLVGAAVFDDVFLDGTAGGPGDHKDVALWLYNDDNNFQYNSPTLSIAGVGAPADPSWFRYIDAKYVSGASPTEAEWTTHGVAGTFSLTLGDITRSGGITPERKFWFRVSVPAGVSTQNIQGLKLRSSAIEEAV